MLFNISNTSLNKSRAWHMDGTTNKKNPYDSYKLLTFKWHMSKFEPNQIISLQIRVTVANFQSNGKIWISFVDKALLSDGKNAVQSKQ